MVFKSFTWQEFLVTALILASIWYLVVLPLLYRHKLKDWLGSRKGKPDLRPVRCEWDEEFENEPGPQEDEGLIGKSKLPEGMSRLGMNMFGFAQDRPEEIQSRELQQGPVPDVIEELKRIFVILEREQGGKEDFMALFGLVKDKYTAIRDTPSERALNEFIRDNALFPISDEELTNLWN
jgi:hypothetical protein